MGSPSAPEKVKLIAGLIFRDGGDLKEAESALARRFGPADFESQTTEFASTRYYEKEFGPGLKRRFLSFERLVRPDGMARVKLITNAIEKTLSRSGKRVVNIDPGYLDLSKLVLLTTKNYFHRIYLGKGIYAEVTLFYRDGSFNHFDWTYPDYRSREYADTFGRIRELYKRAIKDAD